MKYFALALALSSFTFVGCSKKSACDQVVAKLEACVAKATGEKKEGAQTILALVKDGISKEEAASANAKCEEMLNSKDMEASLAEMCN